MYTGINQQLLNAIATKFFIRLSKLSPQALDTSRNIPDLSDKNRPTKLAECYCELYDTQWTDAFETFDSSFNDEGKCITMLVVILRVSSLCLVSTSLQNKCKPFNSDITTIIHSIGATLNFWISTN